MTSFADLPWLERAKLLEPALAEVLAALKHPAATGHIADLVCAKLKTADRGKVASMLVALAKAHPLASQEGPEFMSFGRAARHWIWKPGSERPPALGDYLAQRNAKRAALADAATAFVSQLDGMADRGEITEAIWSKVFDAFDTHFAPLLPPPIDPLS